MFNGIEVILGVAGSRSVARAGVVGASAVTGGDVQETVTRAEGQPTGVMVTLRLVNRQESQAARIVGAVRIQRHGVAANVGVAAIVGEVHVEETVNGVVRMKRQAKDSLLATVPGNGVDVQEGSR